MRSRSISAVSALFRAAIVGIFLWGSVFGQGTTIVADSDGISAFELHSKGLFWWLESICGPEQVQAGKITFRPFVSTQQANLVSRDCEILENDFPNVVRDTSYFYFFQNGQLMRKALYAGEDNPSLVLDTSPFTPTLGGSDNPTGVLAIADGYLYWPRHKQSTITLEIYRMKADGSEDPLKVLSFGSSTNLKKMKFLRYEDANSVLQDSLVLLTRSGALQHRNLTGPQPLTPLALGITDFTLHTYIKFVGGRKATTTIYATKGSDAPLPFNPPPGTLLAIDTKTKVASTVFTASGNNQLVSVATDSTLSQLVVIGDDNRRNIYVTEARVTCGSVFCSITDSFIWRHRLPLGSGNWDLIVATNAGRNLRSDDKWLYYLNTVNDGRRIQRISTDAPPVEIDFAADSLEVIQSIQSVDNDVRLVSKKPTFVRAYAHTAKNTTGQSTWFPGAVLRGFRSGAELNSSPLFQLNNAQVDGTTDLSVLRPDVSRSFLFEIPRSWTLEGSLRFELTVNPEESLPETGAQPFQNNVVSRTVAFTAGASPCVVFVPMATNAPLYYPHENETGFFSILDRAESLLPIERIRIHSSLDPITKTVFEVEIFCGPIPFPPFWACAPVPVIKEVPFTMDGDESWALFWVAFRNLFSGDPDGCDGETYWAGTVHESVPVFNGIGGVPGLTLEDLVDELPAIPIPSTPIDSSMVVRMAAGPTVAGGVNQPSWNNPRGGISLGHELGHNFGRRHIDQSLTGGAACGSQTPDGPYHDFPFDPCFFGASDATLSSTHFGFDPISRQVIAPTSSGDMMSYASSRWISKQTLDTTFEASQGGGGALLVPEGPLAELDGNVLLAHGFINPKAGSVELGAFYQLPPGAFDALKVARSLDAARAMPKEAPYVFRLVDAAGIALAEERLVVSRPSDSDGDSSRLGFAQYLPFDERTQKVRLIKKGKVETVLGEKLVSSHSPTLDLDEPSFDEPAHAIDLTWTASDADLESLTFAVHYRAGEESGWRALLVNYPWSSARIDTRMLPGGEAARLRVIASDGVRSTIAVTEPFALAQHPPEVTISGVTEGERLDYGVLRELRGLAQDAEEGSLPDERLEWSLAGPTAIHGIGASLLLPGLAPGSYTATLTAADAGRLTGEAVRKFEVLPVVVPETGAPELDGVPGDAAYREAAFVRIPMGGGAFARAFLLHSGSDLYVCITDLKYKSGVKAPPRSIGFLVDRNASRDPLAQPTDVGFLVDENGLHFQAVGNGAAMAVTLTPQAGYDAVIERGPGGWSAEMRISDALLGGWNHAAGILFTHNGLVGPGTNGQWPSPSNTSQPVTWARASFGPPLPYLNRQPVPLAGDDQVLHVGATRTVYLNGAGSYDPDGDDLIFVWSQVGGPPVALSGADTATPHFDIKPAPGAVTRRFRLLVSDGHGKGSDDVEVTSIFTTRPGNNPPATGYVRGDADSSSELDISDAVALLGSLFLGAGEVACADAADADDNGSIEITDAIKILGFLFLGATPPPAPGPLTCGADPTADTLTCEKQPDCN